MSLPTSRTSPIMVEREAEIDALDELAGRAAAGQCRMALLTGEAGIGKSRVAREVARRCRARGQCRLRHDRQAANQHWLLPTVGTAND